MMKRIVAGLLCLGMLLCLAACTDSAAPATPATTTVATTTATSTVTTDAVTTVPTQEEAPTLNKDQVYRVLFIGNSYTYYNELWELFRQVGEGAGYTFEVDHVTQGGYYLDQYLNEDDPFGADLADKLATQTYDYVFLQEQSTCPIKHYERFEAAVTALHDKIVDNGAQCVLYQTWARQSGSPALSSLGTTNAAMTVDLVNAYAKAGETLGVTVSPVGAAFYAVHTGHADIELYDPDTTHPSLAGSYLSSLVHFATVTGEDPRKTTFDGGLDAEIAATLRQAAYDQVFG